MADNLIFQIGFDLQKAVEEAGQEWDKKYAAKLESILAKRAVKVKLDFENLTDVKTRLAQLKIEPITPETKSAIKELARELTVLAKALEQVQKYSSKSVGTAEVRGARVDEIEAKAAAARELARQRAAKAEQAELKLAAAREKSANAANKATTAVNKLTEAYGTQTYYIERLLKKMIAVWSVQQVQNFLTNIREVTAQFELQKVSLGAIIQDTNKASQLFSQIKTFALKSPVSIMDLTKYTKQVAAYGVETEKLFDTTKMLTDISVGLGTDVARATLFFGQVFATGHLRASELRQATEMGIPLVDKLAKKLEELNGRGYTAAEVMDLISKRAISFEMVEEVFKDMTSAGGQFYNIQEKQGNTLFGLWAKLGDAASVMYDEIGNTESVNSGMKTAIGLLTELMRNWKAVANTAQYFILPNAAILALYKYSTATQRVEAAQSAAAAATERRKAATLQLSAAIEKGSVDDINAANAALQKAKADEVAAQKATTRMGLLKSGFVSVAKSIGAGLGIGLVIGAVTTLAYKLFEAYENAHRLDRKLDEIDAERITLASQSVRNFEYLADVAVKAADGSKKQKDALDELHRTYKDMIPVQDLTIEHLRQLREGTNNASEAYKSLTTAIREYISEQQKQKKLSAIEEEYGSKITNNYKKLQSFLSGGIKPSRWSETFKMSEQEIERFFYELEKRAGQSGKTINQKIKEALAAAGVKADDIIIGNIRSFGSQKGLFSSYMEDYIANLAKMQERTQAVQEGYAGFVGDLGKYGAEMSRIADVMENKIYKANGKVLESNSFLRKQMQSNEWIKEWANSLKTNLSAAGVEVKNEWFNFIKNLNTSDPNTISSINFDAILEALNTDAIREKLGEHYEQTKNYVLAIQKEYQDLVPQNRTVAVLRAKLSSISQATGVSMDKLQHYWMNADESIEDYAKRIKGTIEDLQKTILEMQQVNADKEAMKPGSLLLKGYSEEEIKQANALLLALQQLFAGLKMFTKGSGGGRTSDPRLQNFKEEISLTKKLYDEYHKLEKQIGATKAAEKIQEIYKNTISTLKERAKKYGFEFKLPFTDENLKANMQHFIDKMKELQGLKDKKGKPLFPNIGKEIDEAVAQLEDVDLNSLQKALEKKLKDLADRISRTKTAKEFYEKILNMTGDIQLSANLAVSVYGQNGQDLQDAIREQIRTAFETDPEKNVTIDLSEAIDPDTGAINYNKLAELEEKYKDVLISGRADLRQKLIDEGRKTSAAQVQQWLKDIEKAKDFAQQRIDLATYTANQIAAINARTDLPQADKDKLTKGYQDREAKQLAKLQYDEFKDSAMYVHIFEDLDHASTTALKNMRDRLIALKGQWQHLDPTQVKELTKAIADLDEQIAGRSPFKSILDGFKGLASARPQKVIDAELLTATEELTRREEALTTATKKYTEAQTAQLNAQAEVAQARQDLENALAVSGGEETAEVKAAREVLGIKTATFNAVKAASKDSISAAKTEVDKASEKYEEQKKVIDKLVEEGKIREANIKKIELANQKIDEYQQQINEALDGVRKMMEAFGASDEDMQFFDDVVGALNEIVDAGQQAAMSVASFMSGNIFGGITSGVSAIGGLVSGFTNLFYAGRVKRANKEIKRQQELLDQLEYTYGRLEKAADKAFGSDFVANQKQQQKILLSQQQAYMKQYEAEMSKGKKADKEKAQEFLDKARDVGDQIADMQGKIAEQMTGTDVASAARDFASAWLEAYASFGNTTDAIREKFNDMIKNMIVESVMAKTVQMALQPMFDEMDKMYKSGASMTDVLSYAFSKAGTLTDQISNGLEVNAKYLESLGINIRDLYASSDNLKGIAKEVGSASSEEINQLSAFVNTALYYVSPIPTISENVSLIRQLMERGTTSTLPDTTAAGWTDWQQQAMDNYNAIARNTADTVVECRRAANACEAATEKLNRAFRAKGATTGFNVFLNS